MKDYFERELNDVVDADNLLAFMEGTDFYQAPASTNYHLACEGGLAIHTRGVLECLQNLNKRYEHLNYSRRSIVIAAVCHDLCKVNMYQEVFEEPSDAQMRYLVSLLAKHGLRKPPKISKAYASKLIDFLLNEYKAGMALPEYVVGYKVVDELPLGHGEKSLYVASKLITLSTHEALAIRWHMGFTDLATDSPFQKYAYNNAVEQCPLVSMLQIADMEATMLVEREVK